MPQENPPEYRIMPAPPVVPSVEAPPVYGQQTYATPPIAPEKPTPKWAKKLGPIGTFLLVLLAKLKTIGTILLSGLKFLKLGKILLTSGTMILSAVLYAQIFGFPFAIGFVITIFVHEMGHVVAAKQQGVAVSAPIFIPFVGALIQKKENAKTAIGEAIIGIGGPIAGTLAGLACWGIFSMTGSHLFLALAYVTFMMNLFNMTPVFPLDGGRITGAVSPYLWLIGIAAMFGMFVTGFVHNPMILILILMGLPRLWHGLKTGHTHVEGQRPASGMERIQMGLAYIGLAGFLFWAMGSTNDLLHVLIRRVSG